VLIYDTTLRDGTQGESISASCPDKIKIAKRLLSFGVDYVEAGWPGSNPKDAEFFARMDTEFVHSTEKMVAFGSTRRKNVMAKDDVQLQTLLDSKAPNVCIVAKSHAWQVTDILRTTLQENLDMIHDSVRHLVSNDRTVLVDLEHFFDGYRSNSTFAMECCREAVRAGAKCLVLCDTNGGTMPWDVHNITMQVVQAFSNVTIGIHAHNDCGMAVANSLMAAKAGAGLIQGTMNGIGERTGNADLCSILPSLVLHMESKVSPGRDGLADLTTTSRFVDEILNRTPNPAAPYVGSSAFAHKGGLHVAAMERSPWSYQHIDPTSVGNEKRVLISELSGRQNILGKIQEVSPLLQDSSKRALAILHHVKHLESRGYSFEGAEASVHLMILHSTKGYCPPFQVLDYSAQVFDSNIDSATRVLELAMMKQPTDTQEEEEESGGGANNKKRKSPTSFGPTARATVNVRTLNIDHQEEDEFVYMDRLEVSDGNGPVDALAKALKRALLPSHPHVGQVELVDYKVRILDPDSATGAATRVMIEFRNGGEDQDTTWTTVSVDRNIISASLNALVDGFEYALVEHATSCMLCEEAY